MELNFTLEKRDVERYARYMVTRMPRLILFNGAFALLITVCVVFMLMAMGFGPTIYLSVPLVALLLGIPGNLRNSVRVLTRIWLKTPGAMEPMTLRIGPEGIYRKSTVSETVIQWVAVERIIDTKDIIVLMLANYQSFLIPRRVFEDNRRAQEFIDACRWYKSGAAAGQQIDMMR